MNDFYSLFDQVNLNLLARFVSKHILAILLLIINIKKYYINERYIHISRKKINPDQVKTSNDATQFIW